MPNLAKPIVKENILSVDSVSVLVGSTQWYEWLAAAKKFSFKSPNGCFVAQCEVRRNKAYWYAYRRRSGKLLKAYLGKTCELTPERLLQISLSLTRKSVDQTINQPAENKSYALEARIDSSFLPITKITVPVLPRQLVSRPRLNQQINTPLTLIYAPSGFGKSTLLNDWKQTCGYPVAWLALDEHDNQPIRFWHSIVIAFQTIHSDFGKELLSYIGSTSVVNPTEALLRLTHDLLGLQKQFPRLGLVLDDFDRINQTEIYDSIQLWVEHLSTNMQLIISGHTRPPLSLGHLRARGLLTELDVNDLRFTVPEGVSYLHQYPHDPPLAHADLEKLVKHAEGWAAGLTLTALALGKQDDHRQFIDTFGGAHIYMREYFMETVLQRSSPEIQSFLLKTAILKNLTGSLCDAVTEKSNGGEMLEYLWQENLFIIRLEEQGWYKYHDLFAEMLRSQLQSRFPEEVSLFHQRAAKWYHERYAPADAIYHLLAIEAWEEAATLMEEMALRELEQFGEDSRLLRWLQALPENIFQKHKNLLFVYLRLANLALPQKKIERFINYIEKSISSKPVALQTEDERDVLTEIQRIRHTWALGKTFTPPTRDGNEYEVRWDLLNRLYLLKPAYSWDQNHPAEPIFDLLRTAQEQHNLFVILMTGGVLSKRLQISGQLRQGEKIARQVLDQAIAQRGKLPEPASIALGTLGDIYLERNEIELAQKYIAQMTEVDPNPTSANMIVQSSISRAKLQLMQRQPQEARATIQAIRDLHLRRPSGSWSDYDLIVYEAFICLRSGDISAAEQLIIEAGTHPDHHLLKLAQAEILLQKGQFELAEKQFEELTSSFPHSIVFEPLMPIRVSLALTLFKQHKINQALQIMIEAIRLAAPEKFIRPFLIHGDDCTPLLSLAFETQTHNKDIQNFLGEILSLLDPDGKRRQVSKTEMELLSTSASISAREQEILHLLSAGYSNVEMAKKLSISESTIKTHLGNIYYKLNVKSRMQAVSRAKQLKIVP